MEHCTGASKEIKFNITYRDKLLHENITRTVLQKEDSHSDDKTEKQQTRRRMERAVGVLIIIRGIAEFAGPTVLAVRNREIRLSSRTFL